MGADTDFKREAQYNMARPGLGSVGSYQVAGHPFMKVVLSTDDDLDTATSTVTFPTVTRSILIKNTTDVDLQIHFASVANNGISNKHYWTLSNTGDSIEMKVKCTKIYITSVADDGGYELFAELTHIPDTDMYDLDRTGLTGISA